MSKIAFYTYNILEEGTVTVTGDPDTGYIESRLHDRILPLLWKDTVTEAKDFIVDQGSTVLPVNFLAVVNHNFDAKALTWQFSDAGSVYTSAVTDWTQSGNTQIEKTIASALTHRYWKLACASIANPYCGEIFMSYGYEFTIDFADPPKIEDVENIQWTKTLGGVERSTKFGQKRRSRSYLIFLNSTNLAIFRTAMEYLDDYSKPFFFKDHEGSYFMARFNGPPKENPLTDEKGVTLVQVNILEML